MAAQGAKINARSHAIRLWGARRVTSTRMATTKPTTWTATSSGWLATKSSTVEPSVEGSGRGDERYVEHRRAPCFGSVVVPPLHPVGPETRPGDRLTERLPVGASSGRPRGAPVVR